MRLRGEEDVGRVSSVSVRPPGWEDSAVELVLDFDPAGRLVGIEFFGPKHTLLPSVLATAERRG